MWESPEPLNHLPVFDCIIEVILIPKIFKQANGLVLNQKRLTVHKRHIEECFFKGFQLIMAACNSFLGKSQGLWVCDEGFRKPPIDVPGELVENNDLCKPSLRILSPFKKLTCSCLIQGSFKTYR